MRCLQAMIRRVNLILHDWHQGPNLIADPMFFPLTLPVSFARRKSNRINKQAEGILNQGKSPCLAQKSKIPSPALIVGVAALSLKGHIGTSQRQWLPTCDFRQ